MSHELDYSPNVDLDAFDSWGYDERRAWLEASATAHQATLCDYRRLVEHLRERSDTDLVSRKLYELGLSYLSADDLTHLDLVDIARVQKQPIVHGDSFWRSIVVRRRKKQLGVVPEKHLGISKDQDQLFIDMIGARRPRTPFTGRFDDIPEDLRENAVLKPVRSYESKGVFYLFAPSEIYSVARSERLASWEQLSGVIAAELGTDVLRDGTWQVQELILGADGLPARDLKFYAFYGHIGLIVEVARYPTMQYAYFNEDLTEALCGKDHQPRFRDSGLTTADKGGITVEKLRTVKQISEQIPVPFMRIDFLSGESELVFCEFSSAPGQSHSLNPTYDRLLGRYYNDAEVRLTNDLLAGKRFRAFEEFSQCRDVAPAGEAVGSTVN